MSYLKLARDQWGRIIEIVATIIIQLLKSKKDNERGEN